MDTNLAMIKPISGPEMKLSLSTEGAQRWANAQFSLKRREERRRGTDRQEQSERQGRRRGDEWAVGRGRASSRAFLACVWARGSGFIAVGPPPPHHPPPPHSSLLLLRQRQAKGGGGATDLAVNRRGVCSSRSVGRLHRQKPRRRKTSPHGKTADVLTRRQLNIASVRLA